MRDTKQERMDTISQSILSGKYEVLQTLGSGSFGTVYLARHQSLESERAIKQIPHAMLDRLSVLSEARLLKSLQHPGIPTIYDIEEDDDYFYLVEEYVRGESLEDFLLHQTVISPQLFFDICDQLCDIYSYLHTVMDKPILYQDLKPAHIIVYGKRIKIIDLGGISFRHFGNAEFSAPETLAGKEPTVSADVFSLGKLMQYLNRHVDKPLSRTISKILKKATAQDPALRYETVEMLRTELQKEFKKIRCPHLVQKIAVAGSHCGCGVTHICVSLVSTLNYMGCDAIYQECNSSGTMCRFSRVTDHAREENGCIHYRLFRGYPRYGPGVASCIPEHRITVADYGSDVSQAALSDADLLLLLCDGAPWNRQNAVALAEVLREDTIHTRIIANRADKRAAQFFAEQFHAPVHLYFEDADAFTVSRQKQSFFTQLLQWKGKTCHASFQKSFSAKIANLCNLRR